MPSRSKEKNREYQARWRTKNRATIIERRNQLKVEILTHYGGSRCQCVLCGESRLACLSIDHINGNGAYARKMYNHYGNNIYSWLRKEGFPLGYQTLCMNCQFCKAALDRSHIKEIE